MRPRSGARAWQTILPGLLVVAAELLPGAPVHARVLPESVSVPAPATAAGPCDSSAAPSNVVYLPNVTKTLGGPAGWVTPLYVQNAGVIQTAVEISFYRFDTGALVVCRKQSGLAPGTTLGDNPNADADLPDNTQFSVVVRSFGAPVVAVVHQLQGSGSSTQSLAYSGFLGGATTVYLPNVTRRFYGYDVPLIIQNLGPLAASVTARFISFDGTQTIALPQLQVQPGRSSVIDPDYTAGLVDGTQYAVTLTSTQPIGVVANAHNEAIGPLAFSHNGLASGGPVVYAPYAVKSEALFSPVVVQNLGTATVDARLAFTPLGGGPTQTFTLTAVPAGGAKAFDPRFALGTTTPCATAVTGSCLGSGEYSLTASAPGPIAAVVLPNSATLASAYVASAAPQPRALVPVALRTVGGASGWTSTIYLQSVGAAQATVRWYAVPSGRLLATKMVTLTAGLSARVDPRTVPELADNGLYATTVEADGQVAAAVLELAASGGDTAMAYEAFALPAQPYTGQPGSISISPDLATVVTGATQQFSALVLDQYGASMPGAPISWSVPSTIGTVTAGGLFSASSTSGTGLVTATSGQVSSAASVTVSPATPVTFGDGTKVIGVDIPPGTYRTRVAASGCYWERLSGFSGAFGDIIANDFTSAVSVVTIAPTDRGFKTTGCGTWTNDLSAITAGPLQPFAAGTFIVGTDIAPGTWRDAGGSSCYWERLSGFGGTSSDILANGFGDVSPIVTISPTDRGFHSSSCGSWMKIG